MTAVGRPAIGMEINEILGAREQSLVGAGAVRLSREQLQVAGSPGRKDDALPVGRPERTAVLGWVGGQPAQRGARELIRRHVCTRGEGEPRAIGRHADVAV